MDISKLLEIQEKYHSKWPDKKPEVPEDQHGWLGEGNKHYIKQSIRANTSLVLEIGSWLGKSTRYILDQKRDLTVVCVDTWEGSVEHQDVNHPCHSKVSTLWETFIVNCWQYRNRLFPLKSPSEIALPEIQKACLIPDLVYIDGSHDYEDVFNDLEFCLVSFPDATIIGDDWNWGQAAGYPVRRAVQYMEMNYDKNVLVEGNAWMIFPD